MTNIVELAKAVVDGLRAMKKELDGIEGILNRDPFHGNGYVDVHPKTAISAPNHKPKKKGKRKYTKRASYWKNPVKKHAKT